MLMVFNATFNNTSVIACRSVLLVDKTGVIGDLPQVTDKHCTDCIGSSKYNYHTITITTTSLEVRTKQDTCTFILHSFYLAWQITKKKSKISIKTNMEASSTYRQLNVRLVTIFLSNWSPLEARDDIVIDKDSDDTFPVNRAMSNMIIIVV